MSNPTSTPVRTRIAPSPTGLPHVGTVRNALYSWLLARHFGGQFLVRIEDTDRERYDAASEQALYDAFRWLGLDIDEGPEQGGAYGPYVQSQRLPLYQDAAKRLIDSGQAYRCFCSRERIGEVREARQKANIHPYGYDRHCRDLSAGEVQRRMEAGEPFVVRFKMPLEGNVAFHDEVRGEITYSARELDDHVLLKSDGFPTYHLAHVVDDHAMEITHAVRSEEWLPSTPRHVLTFQALGWEPPKYIHPPLIMGRDPQSGKISKLSKRHGSTNVGDYMAGGYLPEALLNVVALLGWSPGGDRELMTREEMAELFRIDGINASPSVFDSEKLNWMNGVYIRQLTRDELLDRALPFLDAAGLHPDRAYAAEVLALEQERLKTFAEAPGATEFFFREEPAYDEAAVNKWLRRASSGPVLDTVIARMEVLPAWDVPSVEGAVRGTIEALGVKAGEVIHPTRVAATGRTVGPGLFETLWVLGRDRVLNRLRKARAEYVPGQ